MAYRSVAALTLLALPAFCQSPIVLHSGEAIFTVSVRGGNGVRFRGSCLSITGEGGSVNTELKGGPRRVHHRGNRNLSNSPKSHRRERTGGPRRVRWTDRT
jgi:hypothetical protein